MAVICAIAGGLATVPFAPQSAQALTGANLSLYPNATGTSSAVGTWTVAGSNHGCSTTEAATTGKWACASEDPAKTDNGTTAVKSPQVASGCAGSTCSLFFNLTDVPADFKQANLMQVSATAEGINTLNGGADTINATYQVVKSDGTTAITSASSAHAQSKDTGTGASPNYDAFATTQDTFTANLWSFTRSDLNGAQLKVSHTVTANGGADTYAQLAISSLVVFMSYTTNNGTLAQTGYIWENDDQTPSSANADGNTQQAAGNTAITSVKKGERLTTRVQLTNSGDQSSANLGLFYDHNDGIFTRVQNNPKPITSTGSCAGSTDFNCTLVDSSGGGGVGTNTSTAIDPSGVTWVAYKDDANANLKLARYVGSGGSGCANSSAWTCLTIDATGKGGRGWVGAGAALAFDPTGVPWIVYREDDDLTVDNRVLRVAHYVGSGGSGCAISSWSCSTLDDGKLDDNIADVGASPSIAFDDSGKPWVTYYDGTSTDLRVATYWGGGGSGCTDSAWNGCSRIENGADIGSQSSLAFDASGLAWVAYRDSTNGTLKFAKKNWANNGTTCGTGVTDWDCGLVDNKFDVGRDPSIAFDANGTAYITSYDATNGDLRLATYVGSGGTNACGAGFTGLWSCSTIDGSSNDVGHDAHIVFDAANQAWISQSDHTAANARLTRYVGSGGNCTGNAAWQCTTFDTASAVGYYASVAIDGNGVVWMAYQDASNQGLRVANLNRNGEIVTSAGRAGTVNGTPLLASHTDMSTVSDSGNKSDADCTVASTTWNNGKWWNSAEGTSLTIPAGSGTKQCTEVAWTIDTSQAVNSTTYRFVVATRDGHRADRSVWRGPGSIANYPTMSIEAASASTLRVTKDGAWTPSDCDLDSSWGCSTINAGTANKVWDTSIAFDAQGNAWTSYRDDTAGKVFVARYGASATGSVACTNTQWSCYQIDASSSASGSSRATSLAFDNSGTAWLSYNDQTANGLKVAQFVGTGGTGCSGSQASAWNCTLVTTTQPDGSSNQMVTDKNGKPWIAYRDSTGALSIAQYNGNGNGTGCAITTWTCTRIWTNSGNNDVTQVSIAMDAYGNPWVAAQLSTSQKLGYARYVGQGGSGCTTIVNWSCGTIMSGASATSGANPSITFDSNNAAWVSFYAGTDYGAGKTVRAAQYVGSGGGSTCGTGITDWSCTSISTLASNNRTAIAVDPSGLPWVAFTSDTSNELKVAQYVNSAWDVNYIDSQSYCCSNYATQISFAFDKSGIPWAAYSSGSGGNFRVANAHQPQLAPSYNNANGTKGRNAGSGDLRYHLESGKSPRTESGTCSATTDQKGYCAIGADDAIYDSVSAPANGEPMYTVSARYSQNVSVPQLTFNGQSNVAPSGNSIVIYAYRFGSSNYWSTTSTTSDNCSSTGANTDCTKVVSPSGTASDYFQSDGSYYWVHFLIFQYNNSSAQTLKVDYIKTDQPPAAPANDSTLKQYESTGTTPITTGAWFNATTLRLKATISDYDPTDTILLCAEIQPINTAFANTNTACGSGVAYSGTGVLAYVDITGLSSGTQYHWQVRAKDSTNLYSLWTSYGGNSDGSPPGTPAATDVGIDTAAPSTGTIYSGGSCGTQAAYNDGSLTTLSACWSGFGDTGGSSIALYEYSIGTTAGATNVVGWTSNSTTTNKTVSTLTLKTSQKYYWNVRATDGAGNVSSVASSPGQLVAPTLTFSIGSSAIAFGPLNAATSYTDTQTLSLSVATNAYSGYAVTAYKTSALQSAYTSIADYSAPPASPTTWSGNGFGYTVSGSYAGAGFTNGTKWAYFANSGSSGAVMSHSGAVTGTPLVDNATMSLKVQVPSSQPAGRYTTSIIFSCVATY